MDKLCSIQIARIYYGGIIMRNCIAQANRPHLALPQVGMKFLFLGTLFPLLRHKLVICN